MEDIDSTLQNMSTTALPLVNASDVSVDSLIALHVPLIVFMALLFGVGMTGNTLSLFIYHFRWPRSSFSLCVQSLAILDLINLSVGFPLLLVSRLAGKEGLVLCRLTHGVSHASVFSAGLIMAVIAIERYRKVCKPWERAIPPSTARNLCLLATLVGSVASIPYAMSFIMRYVTVVMGNGATATVALHCHMGDVISGAPWIYVYFGVTGVSLSAVTTLLVTLYVRIGLFILRRHEKRTQRTASVRSVRSLGNQSTTEGTVRRGTFTLTMEATSQSTKVCFVLTIVFFASFLPYILLVALSARPGFESSMSPLSFSAFQVGWFFPFINNVTNPFIYGFFSTRFRDESRKILHCQ